MSPSPSSNSSNVYVYRFTQPTHVAGFPACWGLSCHTAELPYFFNSLDIIREEYSVRGKRGIEEAPVPPEYPYTEAMKAFRGEVGNETNVTVGEEGGDGKNGKRGEKGRGGRGGENWEETFAGDAVSGANIPPSPSTPISPSPSPRFQLQAIHL